MQARTAWLLLGLVPLLLSGAGIAWIVDQRAQVLADLHLEAVEPVLLAARKAELQGKLNLGRSSIQHLVRDGQPDAKAQAEALGILRRLEFGHDGFFFVHDFQGRALLPPRGPTLQPGEAFPVDALLAQARAGGGYVNFTWRRPSSGRMTSKLAYVEPIAGWEWMLGTGSFIDDAEMARERMQKVSEPAVVDTLGRLASVLLLAVLAVTAFALFINVSEQRKADARLRLLAAKLVHSQEDERARLARELHDGVTQSLVSVKFLFESVLARARTAQVAAPVGEQMEQCLARLREVLGEVRGIAHDLRPPLLDDLGLPEALAQLGSEWQERSGLPLRMRFADLPPLSDGVTLTLFRFAQEALANIERHAQARSASLQLDVDGAGLLLCIADDGVGFDPEAVQRRPGGGLGLAHLRERVEALGGQFSVESNAQGSRCRAYLPRPRWKP